MAKIQTRQILAALEAIAYEDDERDVLHGLDALRGLVARDTTDVMPDAKGKGDWTIRASARGLLTNAARIARESGSKRAILRIAASYMGQNPARGETQERHLECLFVVRAVGGRGRPALELVGPVNARPRFLVGYGFWLVAKSSPVSVWLKMKRKRCPVCREWFSDNRRGRPRRFCSTKCHGKRHTV